MGKYDGCKCLICGEAFKSSDDVVVCPDCGTPYHRSCYLERGECVNGDLHASGGTWAPEFEERTEPVRCSRCGQENPPDGLFCNRCGLPLNNETLNAERSFNERAQQGPVNGPQNGYNGYGPQNGFGPQNGASPYGPNAMRFDQDSDIDGVKLGDYARFVGKNQFSFLTHFIRFGKFGGKASLNFCALIFPQYWFFYRKMPLLGVLYMIASLTLSIPTIMVMSVAGYLPSISFVSESLVKSQNFSMILNLTSTALMALQCVSAIFANYWYYKNARKQIMSIRSVSEGEEAEAVNARITRSGGVSWAAFFLAVLISNALVVGSIFVMNKI
ncbi:MAG: DUF2628 domain-containing protein [Ruminococcus sp.]|nr:DUF2628 domain-containing protein [Ruminococcus sp.]